MVAVYTQSSLDGNSTDYLLKDHLGYIERIINEAGTIKETLSYDPWGKRRNIDWTPANESIVSTTHRGFTGHEMLDAIGLVHMNGRIYDSEIGRFLSADPFVQAPENSQSYNRYSYVLNNPLSMTIRVGSLEKALTVVAVVAAGIVTGGAAFALCRNKFNSWYYCCGYWC